MPARPDNDRLSSTCSYLLKKIHAMQHVEQADPGLAVTASVGLCLQSSPARCPCCATGMCAPDRRRAGGRSAAICHATLLPGRTPRGGGRRYRRRDGVCWSGGRRRRLPPTRMPSLRKLVAISPPPGIPESNSHTSILVRVAVWRSRSARDHRTPLPPLRPTPCPPQTWRRPPRELATPSSQ